MININGKPPSLIKINGTVPDIVKINNSIVWKNAFSINFKTNFYWEDETNSSGCWVWTDWYTYLSGFTITANHYFEHLYLDSIKIYIEPNFGTPYGESFSFGYELKSGQTYNIAENFYCGESDNNNFIKVDFYFYVPGKYKILKTVSVSAYERDLDSKNPVLSTTYTDTISAYIEKEIEWINITNAK